MFEFSAISSVVSRGLSTHSEDQCQIVTAYRHCSHSIALLRVKILSVIISSLYAICIWCSFYCCFPKWTHCHQFCLIDVICFKLTSLLERHMCSLLISLFRGLQNSGAAVSVRRECTDVVMLGSGRAVNGEHHAMQLILSSFRTGIINNLL